MSPSEGVAGVVIMIKDRDWPWVGGKAEALAGWVCKDTGQGWVKKRNKQS